MRVPGSRGRRRAGAQDRCLPLSRTDPSCTKRRIHQEDEGPAVKHYLSEDAVSARLQRLSLENDHSYGGHGFPKMSLPQPLQSLESGSSDSSSEEESVIVDPGEFCMNNAKVLSVCPLLEETLRDSRPDSIVPEKILHSLSSPCLELVIWSPPISPIHRLLRSLSRLEDPPMKSRQGKDGPEAEEGMEL
ncbi:host cell factor C1 regulator 1 [Mantella aurantiaca]